MSLRRLYDDRHGGIWSLVAIPAHVCACALLYASTGSARRPENTKQLDRNAHLLVYIIGVHSIVARIGARTVERRGEMICGTVVLWYIFR